jgi:hypothetical protein
VHSAKCTSPGIESDPGLHEIVHETVLRELIDSERPCEESAFVADRFELDQERTGER